MQWAFRRVIALFAQISITPTARAPRADLPIE
jgi:hypothetical protein